MPAILGAPIARALHLPTSVFFGLFSGALLLSAVVGPSVGRLIGDAEDAKGGDGSAPFGHLRALCFRDRQAVDRDDRRLADFPKHGRPKLTRRSSRSRSEEHTSEL